MTESKLQTLGRYWQKQLYLQDWEIAFVLANQLSEYDAGMTEFSSKYHTATVYIKDPKLIPNEKLQDVEVTIVHELLHLHLTPLFNRTDNEVENFAQELAIDQIARAFINEHRTSTRTKA